MNSDDLYSLAEQIEAELNGDKPYSFKIYYFRGEAEKEIKTSLIYMHLTALVEKIKKETQDKDI